MHTAVARRCNYGIFAIALLLTLGVQSDANGQLFRRSNHNANYSNSSRSNSRSTNSSKTISVALPKDPAQRTAVLIDSIDAALELQKTKWDTSDSRSPWGVMHNALAWGIEGEILFEGQRRNSITTLCENRTLKTVKILSTVDGVLEPVEGPGLQGHPGQFLAVLAQNSISSQQPIAFDGREFTVEDLIDYEKSHCDAEKELTFVLLSLCHYCGTDAKWTNRSGEAWDIERLLRAELHQPINRVTCGGTHRLMAIGLAVAQRQREGKEINGIWKAAATYIADYHEYAYSLMNPDGSFSTEWFERRAAASDLQKRLQTTGHVLEWLVVTLPDEELESPTIQKSVYYIGQLLQMDIGEPWSIGPRAHALRSLRIYQQRIEALQSRPVAQVAQLESSDKVAADETAEEQGDEVDPASREGDAKEDQNPVTAKPQ